jgi:excinuclease ABC subunit C
LSDSRNTLINQVAALPDLPGCYLMKRWIVSNTEEEEIIYIGKAKRLRARVKSYFTGSQSNLKTAILVSHITHIDFIVTVSETEAFILENNLIKEHAPRYNIRLKDDKSYPLLAINYTEPFPRIVYTRKTNQLKGKGQLVLGPFVESGNLSQSLQILAKFFGLRQCSLREMRSRPKGCLLAQMHQCQAPCMGVVDESDYKNNLEFTIDFFRSGKRGNQIFELFETKMLGAAKREEFELAAQLRDQVATLRCFGERDQGSDAQALDGVGDLDLVACFIGEQEVDIVIYLVRNSRLIDRRNFYFLLDDCHGEPFEQVLSYLLQYYQDSSYAPPEMVVIPHDNVAQQQLSEALDEQLVARGGDTRKILVRSYGRKFAALAKMAADDVFEQQRVRLDSQQSRYQGLNKLKELLELKEMPRKLECFDIAVWQGHSPTASQVVSLDGIAHKDGYRHYHLEERAEGNNDYAMMREVLERRMKYGAYPDIFIVDGGIGQVNVFLSVLADLDVVIPVVGIAKASRIGGESEERLILPGRSKPYPLSQSISLSRIIVKMRDEAHRFSRRLHHHKEHTRVLPNQPQAKK